jgi:hypothetical protein
MHRFFQIIEIWVALNFAIPAFILCISARPTFGTSCFVGRSVASRLLESVNLHMFW